MYQKTLKAETVSFLRQISPQDDVDGYTQAQTSRFELTKAEHSKQEAFRAGDPSAILPIVN